MNRRENSFRIDYAKVPKKPSFEEVHLFIGNQLGMTRDEVKRIQCSRYLGCAFVKASFLSVAQRIVEEHDGKHELVVDGNKYTIRLTMEDGAVDVKLFDLSEDVSDREITSFLSEYGDVFSIRELMWDSKYMFDGYPTGVRVVRMIVKKNIPSTIIIDGEATCVQYNGQQHTCKHCSEVIHNGISCIQNKKLLVQKLTADQSKQSYANVAKQAASKVNVPKQSRSRASSSSAPRIRPSSAQDPTIGAPKEAAITNNPSQPKGTPSSGARNRSANEHAPTAGTSKEATTTNSLSQPSTPAQTFPSPAVPAADTPQTHLTIPAQEHFKKPQHTFRPESTSTSLSESSRHDGSETDDSASSTSSRRLRARPCAKKIRHDHDVNMLSDFPQL